MGAGHLSSAERGVRVYHMIRSSEEWYGILLTISDPANKDLIKVGLDKILEDFGQTISNTNGDYIYCKGSYPPPVLKKLKEFVSHVDGISKPIIVKGNYEDFVASVWVKELEKKYYLNH